MSSRATIAVQPRLMMQQAIHWMQYFVRYRQHAAWLHRANNYGIPQGIDMLEGWITDPEFNGYEGR